MFSLEDWLREGIGLAKRGKRREARQLLAQVVKKNPRSAVGWLWLASVVETKDQRHYCLKRALQLQPQGDISRRILAEIKSEEVRPQPQVPVSSQYFVGYGPPAGGATSAGGVGGLSEVVERAFAPLGCVPYEVDRGGTGQPLLLSVCQGVFSTRFGVFDLSLGDANTYLELGMALGLNRPVVVVAREGTRLPPVLSGPNVVTYADPPDLMTKLRGLCERGLGSERYPGGATPDYCHFCDRVCEGMATPPDENMYLVLHDSKLLWRVLMRSLTPYLAEHHLYPAYLADRASGPTLCDVRKQVLAAQFALCHLGALSNESSFLALGMAIGSRAPWIVLSERGRGVVPQDLQGCALVEYTTLAHLEERLTDTLGGFLGRIMRMSTSVSGRPAGDGGTTVLSLPFWVQLDDWIRHAERSIRPSETIQGDLRIVQYEGQACRAQHAVPPRGLVVGRSPACDVVVDDPGVSSHHFRVLRGRSNRCFVEDLQSKNGTFLNGSRLPAGHKMELSFNDAVRIPGARFLVWDQRPLPKEQPTQAAGAHEGDEHVPYSRNTALLPPILKIEIPDVAPPSYLDTWDYSLVLTVRIAGSHHQVTFEVQAYYPMERVLGRIVDLLDLPKRSYRFRLKDTPVAGEETPLSLGLRSGDVVTIVADEPGP